MELTDVDVGAVVGLVGPAALVLVDDTVVDTDVLLVLDESDESA